MAMADIPTPTIPELSNLTKAVERPENLASGSQEIQNAALGAAKYIFDLCTSSRAALYFEQTTYNVDQLSKQRRNQVNM